MNKEYYRNYFQTVAKQRLRKRHEKPCAICGTLIHTKGATMCRSCSKKGLIGTAAYHWKGGRYTSRGYVYIYKPDHPRADKRKYVPEHILVLEQKMGRFLKRGEIGHHLNGIKNDNRPENLVALPYQKHHIFLVQKTMQERIRFLENQTNNH